MALKASRLLTPEQVQRLRAKSDLVGALLVLHAWGLIFASMALFVAWPNPLTFVVAVMVIGTRQLGLAILMHDAAHGLLFDNRRLNEWVGDLAVRRAGLHQPAALPALSPDASSPHAAGRGSRSRLVGAVPDQPQEPVAQDRPRPHRPHRLPAPARAVPPRPRQGGEGVHRQLVLLGGAVGGRLLVALSAAVAAAARDLVPAREPDPEHRRACRRARQRRPAAQYPHDRWPTSSSGCSWRPTG